MIVCLSQGFNCNTIVGHDGLTDAQRFMNSIVNVCDALVFFDDGSTDGTRETIGSFGESIQIEIPSNLTNRSELSWLGRARCLEHARRLGATWILALKPDEALCELSSSRILSQTLEFANPKVDAFLCRRRNLWLSDRYERQDGSWGRQYETRLFKLHDDLFYPMNSSRDIVPLGISDNISTSKINILHYGYSTNEGTMRHLADHGDTRSLSGPRIELSEIDMELLPGKKFYGPMIKDIWQKR